MSDDQPPSHRRSLTSPGRAAPYDRYPSGRDIGTTARARPADVALPMVRVPAESVVVVGAGSAGLAIAAALRRRGLPAVLLERGTGVGHSWSLRHEELRLNTTRGLSKLPGPAMPSTVGRWPSRDDYIAYLESFAAHHGLDVRPGVEVARIERCAHHGWSVRTSSGDVHARHVVLATGHERVPWIPDWPGRETFTKPLRHVAEQRRVADLAGKRVLLVGAGNSGVEFAEQLVAAGVAQLWMSVRTPPNLLPLNVAGVPLQGIALAARFLPERLRDSLARRLSRRLFGDLAPFGLATPPHGPYRRLRTAGVTAAVDRGFVAHLKAGRVTTVPEIARLLDPCAVLRDGRTLVPDIVLAATGYRPGLEPIVGELGVLSSDGLPDIGAGMPSPAAPGLWFIGYRPALEGNLRRHPTEARRIARAIDRAVGADNAVCQRPRSGDQNTEEQATSRATPSGRTRESR